MADTRAALGIYIFLQKGHDNNRGSELGHVISVEIQIELSLEREKQQMQLQIQTSAHLRGVTTMFDLSPS